VPEKLPYTAKGRLENFDRRKDLDAKKKDAEARKRYITEVLGDAGVTDFSDEARMKLEDLAEYDEYMQRFSKDQRDSLDRHIEAVDGGLVESKEAEQDPRYRRIAKLALEIAQMEADGSGQKIADNSGKTVLDYRKERLAELQNQYAHSAAKEKTPGARDTQPSPSSEEVPAPDPAYAEEDVVDYPESDSAETPQDNQNEDANGVLPSEEQEEQETQLRDHPEAINPPHTPGAGVEPSEKIGEIKDGDPYQVGKTVRTWISRRNKETKVEDTLSAELAYAVITERSDDGQSFIIEITGPDGKKWQNKCSLSDLESASKVILPEFAYDSRGNVDASKATGSKEWAIVKGPDSNGEVWLTDGNKTIVRNYNSLIMWRHLRLTDEKFKALPVTPLSSETLREAAKNSSAAEDDKKVRNFIDGLKVNKKESPVRLSDERDSSRARFVAREKAEFSRQAKADRSAVKRLLREQLQGAQEAGDWYANSAFGMADRKVLALASRIGSVFKNKKPLSEQYKKDSKKMSKKNKQSGNRDRNARWINVR
jgi:hypothetical protein